MQRVLDASRQCGSDDYLEPLLAVTLKLLLEQEVSGPI